MVVARHLGTLTVGILAEVGGEQTATIDAEGGSLRPDAFVWCSVGEQSINLLVQGPNVGENFVRHGSEKGVFGSVFLVRPDDATM